MRRGCAHTHDRRHLLKSRRVPKGLTFAAGLGAAESSLLQDYTEGKSGATARVTPQHGERQRPRAPRRQTPRQERTSPCNSPPRCVVCVCVYSSNAHPTRDQHPEPDANSNWTFFQPARGLDAALPSRSTGYLLFFDATFFPLFFFDLSLSLSL